MRRKNSEYGSQMRTEPAATNRRLPRPHGGGGPQHLLITLLGDYWFARDELLPSAAIVDLLGEFGGNENASRQAVRRLTQRGLLAQEKIGRSTFYGIPADIVSKQRLRLTRAMTFGQNYSDWDGRWTLVTFSVPEPQREVRRYLRNGLKALGFGDLQDGVWISPRDHRAEATNLLDELGVADGHVMRTTWELRSGDLEAIHRAFKLDELRTQYDEFIAEYSDYLAAVESGLENREALIRRTKLSSDWLSFRIIDPELPMSLLPEDWPRPTARAVFLSVYDRLGPLAASHVRKILEKYDEPLSKIVIHQQAPQVEESMLPEMARLLSEQRGAIAES